MTDVEYVSLDICVCVSTEVWIKDTAAYHGHHVTSLSLGLPSIMWM